MPEFDQSAKELIEEIRVLREQLTASAARSNLVTITVSILGFQLQYKRVPSGEMKQALIKTVKEAASVIGLDPCLDLIKLSKPRFSAWIARQKQCLLEGRNTCGKMSPTKLLANEVAKIKELISEPAFRHFSVTSLAIYARRENLVHASVST